MPKPFPSSEELRELYRDVLDNPHVHAIAYWGIDTRERKEMNTQQRIEKLEIEVMI